MQIDSILNRKMSRDTQTYTRHDRNADRKDLIGIPSACVCVYVCVFACVLVWVYVCAHLLQTIGV